LIFADSTVCCSSGSVNFGVADKPSLASSRRCTCVIACCVRYDRAVASSPMMRAKPVIGASGLVSQ
jgi:hypothetical protein